MLDTTCHCGSVDVSIQHKPDFINDCNCSLCSKAGGLWGYYNLTEVKISGPTHSYSRIDYPNPAVEIHFCPLCGSTTHWVLTEDYKLRSGVSDRMGVNMRLFVEGDLAGVEVRFPDGKAWDGQGDYGPR